MSQIAELVAEELAQPVDPLVRAMAAALAAKYPGARVVRSRRVDWRDVPPPRRGLFVRDLADTFRRHKADLATLIALYFYAVRAKKPRSAGTP